MIAKEIGIDLFDDTTYEASRLMYWPSTCKAGLVGAFCRAYSIEDAVENFLSNIYEKGEMEGRYDYIPATSCAGVVVYDDKFAYSHHATDPACDKLVNAFDMVRIHKFGHLDENVEDNKEWVNIPSYKAMEEFVVNDEKVRLKLSKEREELAALEFDVVEDEEVNNENWQELLELDKHVKVKSTLSNIATIIQYDPKLRNIVYGEGKYKSWDLKEIDQIWAESIFKYKEGEKLFLKGKVVIEASIAQQDAMEGDDREGVVIDHLEKLLPSNWDEMDLYERRSFLSSDEISQDLKGTIKREKVCTNKSGKTRYPLYDPQKTFIRKSS